MSTYSMHSIYMYNLLIQNVSSYLSDVIRTSTCLRALFRVNTDQYLTTSDYLDAVAKQLDTIWQ